MHRCDLSCADEVLVSEVSKWARLRATSITSWSVRICSQSCVCVAKSSICIYCLATKTYASSSCVDHACAAAQGDDDDDEEEDEELQRHYNELEAIKQEEEEKNRQRVLLGAEGSSVDAFAEDGDEGGTWEDAAAADDTDSVKADDDMGLKPINHEKWQQRQVCQIYLLLKPSATEGWFGMVWKRGFMA